MRVLMLGGQQLTIGHERRWDRGLRAVLDPAATDVQTGGKVWWGDNDSQCVSVCVCNVYNCFPIIVYLLEACTTLRSPLHLYEHMSACLIHE